MVAGAFFRRAGGDDHGGRVQRTFLSVLLALGMIAVALPASAASDREFKAQFRDRSCATHDLCGSGLVQGYGHATTTFGYHWRGVRSRDGMPYQCDRATRRRTR
jgi:hypothetical protein